MYSTEAEEASCSRALNAAFDVLEKDIDCPDKLALLLAGTPGSGSRQVINSGFAAALTTARQSQLLADHALDVVQRAVHQCMHGVQLIQVQHIVACQHARLSQGKIWKTLQVH